MMELTGESAPAVMPPPAAALKLDVMPHYQCKAAFEVG